MLTVQLDCDLRVALNALFLTKIGLVNTVNLGESDVLLLEGSGGLLIVRGECLAVTAPVCAM
jgi:hypothetical protein